MVSVTGKPCRSNADANPGKYVVISCRISSLTHHYVTRSGESIIYMATNIASLPSVGELRFIARLSSSELPNSKYIGASTGGSSSTVEGSDVFIVNGETRSKFYSSERFIDDEVHCEFLHVLRSWTAS